MSTLVITSKQQTWNDLRGSVKAGGLMNCDIFLVEFGTHQEALKSKNWAALLLVGLSKSEEIATLTEAIDQGIPVCAMVPDWNMTRDLRSLTLVKMA